ADYDKKQILYTLINLCDARLIEAYCVEPSSWIIIDVSVYRITYDGHEFIETFRSKTTWGKKQKKKQNLWVPPRYLYLSQSQNS
ncbi:DUF2513 domain-containing protein, partial [Eubacterium aggregans]|uniref:DUF2513 domain-containing protein n=1 Tax=Eubacterium aggregans TaxID=81409 RepID=UPI003F3E772D